MEYQDREIYNKNACCYRMFDKAVYNFVVHNYPIKHVIARY